MVNSNPLLLVVSLIFILSIALGINYFFNSREEERNRRRQLTRQLQLEIEQTLKALQVLKSIRCPAQITGALGDYSISLIGHLRTLNPESGVLEQLQSHSEVGITPADSAPPPLTSLTAIQHTQVGIRNALKALNTLQRQGKLTPLSFSEFKNTLSWLHTEVEADAYIEQGKRLAKTEKIALAMSHFKHAKVTVSKAMTRDPRKREKIDAINQMLDDINPFKKAPKEAEKELASETTKATTGARLQSSSRPAS